METRRIAYLYSEPQINCMPCAMPSNGQKNYIFFSHEHYCVCFFKKHFLVQAEKHVCHCDLKPIGSRVSVT